MHQLYFVLLDKENAFNTYIARETVSNILEKQNFSTCPGKCDWFVIGGRWSGILGRMKSKLKISLLPRNIHEEIDHRDDAIIVDQHLCEQLVNTYHDVEIYDANERKEYCIKNLPPDRIIGRWIVVVDYHY